MVMAKQGEEYPVVAKNMFFCGISVQCLFIQGYLCPVNLIYYSRVVDKTGWHQ